MPESSNIASTIAKDYSAETSEEVKIHRLKTSEVQLLSLTARM
jgi:hypothetical protein